MKIPIAWLQWQLGKTGSQLNTLPVLTALGKTHLPNDIKVIIKIPKATVTTETNNIAPGIW